MSDSAPKILLAALAAAGLAIGYWYVSSFQPVKVGVFFLAVSITTLVVVLLSDKLFEAVKYDDDAGGFEITLPQSAYQFVAGSFLGLIPIVLSILTPLSITLPTVQLSVSGQALTSIIVAPLIEEPAFLFAVPVLLVAVAYAITKSKGASLTISFLGTCAIFSLCHWAAYGASALVSAQFLGAAVFRAITLLIVLGASAAEGDIGFGTNSAASVIIATIVMHAMFNAYVLIG